MGNDFHYSCELESLRKKITELEKKISDLETTLSNYFKRIIILLNLNDLDSDTD